MKANRILFLAVLAPCIAGLFAACSSNSEKLSSPDGSIEVSWQAEDGDILYAVRLNGEPLVEASPLGLKAEAGQVLEVYEVSRSAGDESWEAVWGPQRIYRDAYREIRLRVGGASDTDSPQTIVLRAYDDGVAFRYELPEGRALNEAAYQHEASSIRYVSKNPIAWHPLSSTLVSDAIEVASWEPEKEDQARVTANTRYTFKPKVIKTPLTLKLADDAYLSLHEAGVNHAVSDGVQLEGNSITYRSDFAKVAGRLTPWRTLTIGERPGELIESTLIVNLNEPSRLEDSSWIKPGKSLWDWRNHGAHADDGFEYGLTTESYLRYVDFAAENNLQYVMVDAEWYGPEHDFESDPKTFIPEVDIQKICSYAKSKGVALWLYVNSKAFARYDLDETLSQYQEWGVAGVKMGFLGGAGSSNPIELSNEVVRKCAEYQIQYVLHEPYKPSGYQRTYPNILAYEYVNSMLDGPSRPSATPSRLINQLFVHALAGPVDRSCGMFDLDTFISREKCHRQIPSTVASQVAQCLLFPSGLLTLPDHPDAYRRKADLFEFIARMPMTWDETKVLDAEIGKHITLARRSGEQWFVASLADEAGREGTVALDFLEEGVSYDVTLYEDAPGASYEYYGPGTKKEATEQGLEMKPHETKRELYQVRRLTAKRGDVLPIVIAPGGGHSMWIRPAS
ncbi:glycoside hydrolase family 97 catalytic domain-containing protein [Pelagicoccus sp. SDUM812005]|uniref:glycoside hydrolase family 97 protein n=1 Tax=Pelagicoccus sp. SDUM812005 TaxID=3041257 RepID=UPI00280EE106|nr:glycoside hydrolase family 97 catalytic domain-containing protein [Pelagicoccus sp. SDUM812005]MDQ8180283.1 glycoside hydrolase family 97 catalytic domain-containing protein [Pelagicoccus sp. SDUM812005]